MHAWPDLTPPPPNTIGVNFTGIIFLFLFFSCSNKYRFKIEILELEKVFDTNKSSLTRIDILLDILVSLEQLWVDLLHLCLLNLLEEIALKLFTKGNRNNFHICTVTGVFFKIWDRHA